MKSISLNGRTKLSLKNSCAAIGIFDGVHRGHQYLIKLMLATARRLRLRPMVITFYPHPAHVLRPDLKLGYITSLQDRFRLLNKLGAGTCLVVPFNRAFAKIEPQKFIKDILVKKLGVKAIFVGKNFKFGKDRSGDTALFQKLALEYGYQMHAVAALKQSGEAISSTRIRQLTAQGDLVRASRLLGRHVGLSGMVVKGSQRGKLLGFPTANIAYEADILPPRGVYLVRVLLGTKKYFGLANIGTRPSFEEQDPKLSLEVYILDFSKNIYGKHLDVEFLKKIRDEIKFPNPQQLIRQIQKDEKTARKYFKALRR